jgi:hypothetical protein
MFITKTRYGRSAPGFGGPEDQKCFQRVLLRFVVWGSEKLILGVLTKNKVFFLQITHNGEHIKNSKKNF